MTELQRGLRRCILLLLMILSLFAYKNDWWVISPSGVTDENATGNTAGQPAVGDVTSLFHSGSYGFWYDQMDPFICFEISTLEWFIDSISVSESRSMIHGEQMELTNCGNCHIGFGLRVIDSSPIVWAHGYAIGDERFVLRARFVEGDVAPTLYDFSRDYVSDVVKWASPSLFGPDGFDFSFVDELNLWLQFVAPTDSELWGDNTITMELSARANLP